MDGPESDWAAHGLFSPSKARLAQVQAKDWAFVDAWLVKKYSAGRVPVFERNSGTLQALLALISANEAADTQRQAVQRVQRSAAQYLTKPQAEEIEELTRTTLQSIGEDAASSLQELSQIAVNLDASTKDGSRSVLTSIAHLQNEVFESQQHEATADQQLDKLSAEHTRLAALIHELSGDGYQPSDATVEETSEWLKGSKHLRAKIAEYDDRMATSKSSGQTENLVAELSNVKQSIRSNQNHLELLQAQVSAIQQLAEHGIDKAGFVRKLESQLSAMRKPA